MALNKQDDKVRVKNCISLLDVNVIKIAEDKLENILTKHIDNLKKPRDIVGAFGLFVSLLGIIFTAEFKNFGLPADTWKGIFIVFFIISIGYLVYVIHNLRNNNDSIESIMDDIKGKKEINSYHNSIDDDL